MRTPRKYRKKRTKITRTKEYYIYEGERQIELPLQEEARIPSP
jgi:hypothetical protein